MHVSRILKNNIHEQKSKLKKRSLNTFLVIENGCEQKQKDIENFFKLTPRLDFFFSRVGNRGLIGPRDLQFTHKRDYWERVDNKLKY